MAEKKKSPGKGPKKAVRRVNFVHIHKLFAAVALLSFLVVVASGLRAGAALITITWRAFLVMLVLKIISVILVRILATYEEMNSGQA